MNSIDPRTGVAFHRQDHDSPCDLFPAEELDRPIHARFEKMVALHGPETAVRWKGKDVTYDAMNRFANRVARSVKAALDRKGGRIALLSRHRPEALSAMLGVLKSGNAYVPLDPSLPSPRILQILEDSGPDLIIADRESAVIAAELAVRKCPALLLTEIDGSIPDDNPGLVIPPDSPAYVIYTSGSTGKPKGVTQTHRNLLHFIRSYGSGLRITATDRLSLLPSFGFSAALMDIYGALLNGAAVCLFDVREEGSAGLAAWLAEEKITVYHSVPALFRHFVSGLTGAERFPSLRAIDLGGEPLFDRDVKLFQRHFEPECVLVNHLAFTEASVVARNFIQWDDPVPAGRVPVGFPADGVEVLLLDEEGRLAGEGIAGEIVLRSRYLSPGYWGQPKLTRAAFSPDPEGSGARLYRSGDLGRLTPDGLLEYLGRKDYRAKIRGFTIEPAEVETALLGLESVRDAAVLAREGRDGENALVAYLVPDAGEPLTAASLRELLRLRLPEHMVPSEFVFLDALPLNPNGKVDRAALPSRGSGGRERNRSRMGPRNDIEQRLANLWAEALELDEVSISDDFFDVGGHSLRAFHLFAMIEREFGQKLSPSILLRAPTLGLLASEVEERIKVRATGGAVTMVPLRTEGSLPPLFCIAPIADNALWYRCLAAHVDQEHPLFCIESSEEALALTMAEVASRCIEAIRTVSPSGPFFLVGYSSGGVAAFEVARQLRGVGLPVALLVMLDTPCPIPDSERGLRSKAAFLFRVFRNLPGWLYYYWRTTEQRGAQFRILARKMFGLPISEASNPFRIAEAYLEKVSGWLNTYRPEPYPGRIVFFRARGQKLLRHLKLDEEWRKFADTTDVRPVPGHHTFILKEPHVRVLADRLNRELRNARG